MSCRQLTQCEINNILRQAGMAEVSTCACCARETGRMCSSSVRVNGDVRLTLEGNVSRQMMNAIADGGAVTVHYTGNNCQGQYHVTATGEPENVTMCCNRLRFTLDNLVTEGVIRCR